MQGPALWGQLMAAMEAQLSTLSDLLHMERKKTEVLLAGNPSDLEVLLRGEQVLLWQLARQEEERFRVQQALAVELGESPQQLTLARMVELAPTDCRDQFSRLAERYRETCEQLGAQNHYNTELIRGALAYCEFAHQLWQSQPVPGKVYQPQGTVGVPAAGHSPRFLDNRT